MSDNHERARALLSRVLCDPAFRELFTENHPSPDILVSPADALREKAKLMDTRDKLIRDIREFFGG